MIRKYYIDMDAIGGEAGGGDPNAPVAPKNYVATTPAQREEWNGFLDYAGKQSGTNMSDAKAQAGLLAQYKKANPAFSITAEQIPNIQYEAYQIRKGDKFGNLGTKELGYLRQGFSPNFLNVDTANVGKLYYPHLGSYGTDIENYYNSKFNPAAAKPVVAPAAAAPIAGTTGAPAIDKPSIAPLPPAPPGAIARPDYNDPASRLKFAQNWTAKYGPLMASRGDTPLRVNEIPRFGSDTSKNLSEKAYGALGIDPALGYASAMEEGMSAEFPDKDGDYKFDDSGNKDYPVTGSATYGLDTFVSRFPELVQKGYLPASFKSQFIPLKTEDKSYTQDSALYKTADAALQAKAAFLKSNYDEVDDYIKSHKIPLSPRARDFFALANYNAGKGVGLQMIADYNKNGYLKNDAFMSERPTKGEGLSDKSYGPTYDEHGKQTGDGVYTNVKRRVLMAEALRKEGLFKSLTTK